jgi:DNA primase
VGGDVIRLIELVDQVDFREATTRLGAAVLEPRPPSASPKHFPQRPSARSKSSGDDPDGLQILKAAAALYHRRLLTDSAALAYVEGRGIDRATIEACQVGFSAGNELLSYLRWRSLSLGPALGVGLLDASGREFLAGRIVVPDLTSQGPAWMIGRLLEGDPAVHELEDLPKYLGLPGTKPVFGSHVVSESPAVVVTEGAFDYLTLRTWGYPALALMGTHCSEAMLQQLRSFARVYVVFDQDDAGFEATLRLIGAMGSSAIPVALPDGTKDVAELATIADGRILFAQALVEAAGPLSDRSLCAF